MSIISPSASSLGKEAEAVKKILEQWNVLDLDGSTVLLSLLLCETDIDGPYRLEARHSGNSQAALEIAQVLEVAQQHWEDENSARKAISDVRDRASRLGMRITQVNPTAVTVNISLRHKGPSHFATFTVSGNSAKTPTQVASLARDFIEKARRVLTKNVDDAADSILKATQQSHHSEAARALQAARDAGVFSMPPPSDSFTPFILLTYAHWQPLTR